MAEQPGAESDKWHGQKSPHPDFYTSYLVDPFSAEHAKAVEERQAAEVAGGQECGAIEHCKEHCSDAAQHTYPLRQAEEERRNQVEAKEDVDVPEEGGFAPARVEEKVAQRME